MTPQFQQARDAAREIFNRVEFKGPVFRDWLAFHKANRHVYAEFVRILRQAKIQFGWEKWSIQGAAEVLRWETSLRTSGGDFKIANAHLAYYSRLIQMKEELLFGFMDVSRSIADVEMGWKQFMAVMRPPKPIKKRAASVGVFTLATKENV